MNNRGIIPNNNYQYFDNEKNLPDKECCLVCSIIICYHFIFVGIMIKLIQNEDLNLNSTIF